jgi:hypothetical protein
VAVTVSTQGLHECVAYLARVEVRTQTLPALALEEVGQEGVLALSEAAPASDRAHMWSADPNWSRPTLANSFYYSRQGNQYQQRVDFHVASENELLAEGVRFGVPAHLIPVQAAKALVFWWENGPSGAHLYRAQSVVQGHDGHDFVEDVEQFLADLGYTAMDTAMDAALGY